MKRYLPIIYAWTLILLFLAAQICAFVQPFLAGFDLYAFLTVGGFALSCVLTPILHELGHIVFAKSVFFRIQYSKFSFFALKRINGKLRFSFASPFAAEQTQAYPLNSGNMKNRLLKFTVGGLVFSGLWLFLLFGLCVLFYFFFDGGFYFTVGALPFAAYLFCLNLPAFRYQAGKSDSLVYKDLKKGEDVEKWTLSLMEIYGNLAEGKTFGEIDKKLYFDLPVIPEDEQAYAAIQLARYRYFLDCGDFDGAADSVNRLMSAGEYLDETALMEGFFELVFMHSLNADKQLATECYSRVEQAFESDAPIRVKIAYAAICGEEEKVKKLLGQVDCAFFSEFLGVERSEKRLLEKLRATLLANKV